MSISFLQIPQLVSQSSSHSWLCEPMHSFLVVNIAALVKINAYRIAGNFREGLIFVIFMTALTVMKFSIPRKFATVGKGHLVKLPWVCTRSWSNAWHLPPTCRVSVTIQHSIKFLYVTLTTVIGRFARWWRMGRGKCDHQEPRNLEPWKLILEAKSYFSRKFIPPKITCYTVYPWYLLKLAEIAAYGTVATSIVVEIVGIFVSMVSLTSGWDSTANTMASCNWHSMQDYNIILVTNATMSIVTV